MAINGPIVADGTARHNAAMAEPASGKNRGRRMHFDFIDLRLLAAVLETGSITAGAERVGLSLAAASARMRGLEQQAGVAL
ncbi:helix-turn-helix domain-containing protein, partial [Serratia marcescens]